MEWQEDIFYENHNEYSELKLKQNEKFELFFQEIMIAFSQEYIFYFVFIKNSHFVSK